MELVKAVMWSAGNVAAAARSGENTAAAELCLVSAGGLVRSLVCGCAAAPLLALLAGSWWVHWRRARS